MANNRKKRKMKAIIFVLIFVIIALIVAIFGYSYISKDINGSSQNGSEYTLVIEDNDYQYEVAQKLKNNKIVISDIVWNTWLDKNYPDFTFYNGEYYLSSNMSYDELVNKLKNPDISHKKITVAIPEGYNIFDISKTLEENNICSQSDFMEACKTTDGYDYEWLSDFPKDNKNIGFILEGFLFPATYDFPENSDAKDIVDMMLDAFDDRISDDMTNYCKKNDMSLYELITLSSIVQEEALNKESQGNIASVLINRLEKGSKLQCDVTYYYARDLRDKAGYSQEVYDSYYTYRCSGLPSGPITNCGTEIINSTINHPDTDYLFFFSDLNGEFHFASSSAEFEKQKNQYPWK